MDLFCSLLAWILIENENSVDWMEMECEYMWGLLDSRLLNGEGGYYLTLLSSTINLIDKINSPPLSSVSSNEDVRSILYSKISELLKLQIQHTKQKPIMKFNV